MSNLQKTALEPEQIALRRVTDAIHAYADELERALVGGKQISYEDRIGNCELAKLHFRNQLLAIEGELSTALLNQKLYFLEINDSKKESIQKRG